MCDDIVVSLDLAIKKSITHFPYKYYLENSMNNSMCMSQVKFQNALNDFFINILDRKKRKIAHIFFK